MEYVHNSHTYISSSKLRETRAIIQLPQSSTTYKITLSYAGATFLSRVEIVAGRVTSLVPSSDLLLAWYLM